VVSVFLSSFWIRSCYSILFQSSGTVPAVSNMGLHLKLEQQQTLATNQYPLSSMAAAAAAAAAANLAHNQVSDLNQAIRMHTKGHGQT
jgi:hypothetical protein